MNDTELDAVLDAWEAPEPSPALRESVRHGLPSAPPRRSYRWMAAAASVMMTTSLVGVAMLGRGQAHLADGSNIQSSLVVEPSSATDRWHALGFGQRTGGNLQQGYCANPATHTYVGYDLTVEPQRDGRYRVSVQPLSRSLSQFGPSVNASEYRQSPLPVIPASRIVMAGEAFDIDLIRDAKTGDRVFERVELSHESFLEGLQQAVHRGHAHLHLLMQHLFGAGHGQ